MHLLFFFFYFFFYIEGILFIDLYTFAGVHVLRKKKVKGYFILTVMVNPQFSSGFSYT